MEQLPVDEREFLENARQNYVTSEASHNRMMRTLVVRTFAPFLHRGRGLELGCSDGYMTQLLKAHVEHLDVVDGNEHFLAQARARNIPNARFFHALFEEFSSDVAYDAVFACFVLEHVADAHTVLKTMRAALKPSGLLFVAVPNARTLSRQLARHMGLIRELTDLTANDIQHGHRRVYDRVNINRALEAAGFEIITQGGVLIKPLADFQMDQLIDSGVLGQAQIDGLYRLGMEYPDLCGWLYAVCRPGA